MKRVAAAAGLLLAAWLGVRPPTEPASAGRGELSPDADEAVIVLFTVTLKEMRQARRALERNGVRIRHIVQPAPTRTAPLRWTRAVRT